MVETILIFLFVGVAVYKATQLGAKMRPSRRLKKTYRPKPDYSAEQLTTVMRSTYSKSKIMNKGEFLVFKTLEDEIKKRNGGRRIFSQVSLGEILKAEDAAYRAINSKRVDILIVDAYGYPELVVEHQGQAHYSGNAAARDAVKREALRRAGVFLIETFEDDTQDDIRRKVFPRLGWAQRPSPRPASPVTPAPPAPTVVDGVD